MLVGVGGVLVVVVVRLGAVVVEGAVFWVVCSGSVGFCCEEEEGAG